MSLIVDETTIQKYLQDRGIAYLKIIAEEYASFMTPEQRTFLNNLLAVDFIKVDIDGKEYLLNQEREINSSPSMTPLEKETEIRNLNIPLAHGGRVFNDNKIHFYPSVLLSRNPNLTVEQLNQKCEEVLIHELLHFFIRPMNLDIKSNQELAQINDYITEGLVDMCARDIHQKYKLFPGYNSDYGSNVIFVREALSNIPSKEERTKLVFSSSISKICHKTTTSTYDTKQQFIKARDKQTRYDKLIRSISQVCYPLRENNIYNSFANFESKSKALENIENKIPAKLSSKIPLIQNLITAYKNGGLIKLNEDTLKKPFDVRSKKEIEVAEQIRIKNQMIAKQNQNNLEKPKTLVKAKPNSGHVNVAILSLTIILIIIIIVVGYLIIK